MAGTGDPPKPGLDRVTCVNEAKRDEAIRVLRNAGEPVERVASDGNNMLDTSDAGIALLRRDELLDADEIAHLISDDSADDNLTDDQIERLIAKLEARTEDHKREQSEWEQAAVRDDEARRAALLEHQKKLTSLIQSVDLAADFAQRQLGSEKPADIAGELEKLLHSRERALQEKYRELQEKENEDMKLTEALRLLQKKVQEEVPKMTQDRDEQMDRMTREWERDMQQLERERQQERQKSMTLLWHVNRGTHIRPEYKDPRKKGTFGIYDAEKKAFVEDPQADDRRLKAQEEKLLMQHNATLAELKDLDAEKVLVQRRREAIAAKWDQKPLKSSDGKQHPPIEGTKLWYNQEIARLKQRVAAEEKTLKQLLEENKDLKDKKNDVAAQKKQITRSLHDQLLKMQRNAHRKTSPGPAQVTGKPNTAANRSVTAPPRQITDAPASGSRRRPAAAAKVSAKG